MILLMLELGREVTAKMLTVCLQKVCAAQAPPIDLKYLHFASAEDIRSIFRAALYKLNDELYGAASPISADIDNAISLVSSLKAGEALTMLDQVFVAASPTPKRKNGR